MKSGICTEEGLPGRTVGKLSRQSRELSFCVCFFLPEPGLGICLPPFLARTDLQEVMGGPLGKRHGKRQRDPEGTLRSPQHRKKEMKLCLQGNTDLLTSPAQV